MPNDLKRLQDIFEIAAPLAPADRASVVERECAGDPGLRQKVEALLQAHDDSVELPGSVGTSAYVPTIEAGQVFAGRFKLREVIGEGGMGVVFVADQLEPVQRRVALKIIRSGMDTRRMLARFEQERQALALMDHPNIAKVFDAGTDELQRPFFAMELVKGLPLTKYCDEAKLTPRQRIELFVPVCHAVQHAHQKGIIHRDLKPSNILVGLYDGRPVPKVIDFGVAKATGARLTEQSIYTEIGSIVGTLEYMSPEQAELNNLDIDTRSDIYSLGVILYELLTGAVPFNRKELEKAGLAEMLRVIKEVEPSKPSTKLSGSGTLPSIAANRHTEPNKLTALVRGELDWIVMKALDKDRGRRYETANGFAMDVQRYLADEAVHACPPSVGYRMRKFVRRNKRGLAATALVGVLLVVSAVVATVFAFQADQSAKDAFLAGEEKKKEAARATLEAENATLARREAERVLGMQIVSNGVAAMDKGDFSGAAIWFAEAGRRDRSDPERSQQHLLRLRGALRQCARPEHILFHDGEIWFTRLSPDGARLVTAGKNAQVWDAHTGAKLGPSLPHDALIQYAQFSKDGRRLLTMTNQSRYGDPAGERFVRVWDVASGRLLTPPLAHKGWGGIGFMLDDECVLTRSGPKTVQLWHTETGKPAGAPFEHPANLDLHLACSPDGQFMATLTSPTMGGQPRMALKKDDPPSQLWLWNVRTRHSITLPLTSRESHMGAEFSPDSSRLIYNDSSDVAVVLDVRTGKRLSTYHRPGAAELWHAFAPNGRHVFSWSMNRNVPAELWDMDTGRAVGAQIEYHNDFDYGKAAGVIGYHAVLSPDGRRVLAPPPDEPTSRVVWDAMTGKRLGLPIKHETMITSESFSPDGRLIVAASEDGTVRTWKASRKPHDISKGLSFAPAGPPMMHDREVSHLRFSADGRRLITIAGSVVRIWPLVAELEPDARLEHPHPVTRILRTSDGRRAVTVTQQTRQSFEIRIWDLTTGKLVGEPRRYADDQYSVNAGLTISPDNRRVFLNIGRSTMKGREPGGGSELGDLETGRWQALSLNFKELFNPQFSATGRYLLLTRPEGLKQEPGYEIAQRLYETATGRDVSELLGRQDAVTVIGWSPDDRLALLLVESAPSPPGGKGTVPGVQVWDLEKRRALTPVLQHEGTGAVKPGFPQIGRMARFSQDGRVVLTEARLDAGAEARIWDAQTGTPLGPIVQIIPKGEAVELDMMAELSPNGRHLLVAGMAFPRVLPVRLWDLITGTSVELPGAIDIAGAIGETSPRSFSPDGRRVLAKTANGLRLFDGESGAPVTPELTPGPAYRQRDHFGLGLEISGQLSLDGSRVLTENPTQIWDAATAQPLTPPFPPGLKNIQESFAFRGNGDAVLIRERPNVLALYRLSSAGKSVEELAVLAETLGGRRLTASGNLQTLDAAQLASGWKTLRATEPAPPSGPAETLAWHRRQIELLDYHTPAGFIRGTGLGSLANLHEWVRATKPIDMVERTNAYAARWHLDRILAVERKPDLVAVRGYAHCVLGDWDKAVADFNEAMNGGVPQLVGPRGEAYAELGRFEEASADFLKALPDQKDPQGLLMKLAYAQSAARDEAGLRETRDQLRLHLNKNNPHNKNLYNPQAVFLLWPLAFDPPRDPEFARLLKTFEDVWMSREGIRSFERANNLTAVGLARYRLGDYEAALAALSVAEPLVVPEYRHASTLLLALTCQKLKRATEARAWLDMANKLDPPSDQHWIVRLVRQTLRREADELIKPK